MLNPRFQIKDFKISLVKQTNHQSFRDELRDHKGEIRLLDVPLAMPAPIKIVPASMHKTKQRPGRISNNKEHDHHRT